MVSEVGGLVLSRVCGAMRPGTVGDLADMMGWDDEDSFRKELAEECPACLAWFEEKRWAAEAADLAGRLEKSPGDEMLKARLKAARMELIRSAARAGSDPEFDPFGRKAAALAERERILVAARPSEEVRKPAKVRSGNSSGKARPVGISGPLQPGVVGEGPMAALAKGMAGEYMGRPVVAFEVPAGGVFGTGSPRSARLVAASVAGGIPNCCSMKAGAPTPYWAVLDAMCQLGEFTKKECVDLACKREGVGEKAAMVAFDVLKGHHKHPRKREAGMAHMVEDVGGGRMRVRERNSEETMAYFDDAAARKAEFGSARGVAAGVQASVVGAAR